MLLEVVWPGHEWAESALRTRFTSCPLCTEDTIGCEECLGTRLVTTGRHKLLAIEALAERYALQTA